MGGGYNPRVQNRCSARMVNTEGHTVMTELYVSGTAFFFIAVVVNAFMVLVTATYPVVKMGKRRN